MTYVELCAGSAAVALRLPALDRARPRVEITLTAVEAVR